MAFSTLTTTIQLEPKGILWSLFRCLPIKELQLNDDVKEAISLLHTQCSRSTTKLLVDPRDDALRLEVPWPRSFSRSHGVVDAVTLLPSSDDVDLVT
uniref:Uncharacterized protein n=1 Tax=Malus domestica TaxID=3750 RepID=E4Z8M7_MALDO|nr:hypothetical protein [Malus domestica]